MRTGQLCLNVIIWEVNHQGGFYHWLFSALYTSKIKPLTLEFTPLTFMSLSRDWLEVLFGFGQAHAYDCWQWRVLWAAEAPLPEGYQMLDCNFEAGKILWENQRTVTLWKMWLITILLPVIKEKFPSSGFLIKMCIKWKFKNQCLWSDATINVCEITYMDLVLHPAGLVATLVVDAYDDSKSSKISF